MRYEDLLILATPRARTDKAILLQRRDGAEVWVPLSQVLNDPPELDEEGDVLIAGWFAHKESLQPDPPGVSRRVVAFSCRPIAQPRTVTSAAFGKGQLVEDKGDRVVADFPGHGRKTLLRSRCEVSS